MTWAFEEEGKSWDPNGGIQARAAFRKSSSDDEVSLAAKQSVLICNKVEETGVGPLRVAVKYRREANKREEKQHVIR